MKKLLLSAAAAIIAMTACQKTDTDSAASGEVTLSVAASLPAQMAQTRANGDASAIDRCIMEIYLDGRLYGERHTAKIENLATTFSVRLLAGKTYDFVFWADHADENGEDLHYNTENLPTVTIADIDTYAGNDEGRDAFFGTASLKADLSSSLNIELKRPFGQINVNTLDMDEIPADMQPSTATVAFESIPVGIDLLSGELTADRSEVSYTAELADKESGLLVFDYIFAPAGTEQFLTNFTMTCSNDGGQTGQEHIFSSIPVQRNYRTNLSGYLFTKQTDINIEVKPEFDGEIPNEIPDESTIKVSAAELQAALDAIAANGSGEYTVNVTDNIPAGSSYILPAVDAASAIAINLVGAEGEVEFASDDFEGLLALNNTVEVNRASEDEISVKVNLTKGAVAFDSGAWEVTSVATASAVTVNEGATVSTLNVKSGDVVINCGATVGSVSRTDDNTDESTSVNVFDGAAVPEVVGEDITVHEAVTGQIMIGDRSFATLAEALAAAQPHDTIELAEGEYPLNQDIFSQTAQQYFYLPIEVEGLTIKGRGDAANTIIYGEEVTGNGAWGTQSTIIVFAANVRLENLTLMPKQETNKLIEVMAANFQLVDCIITANTLVEGADPNDAASIYFNGASDGTISGCTINKGNICFDGVMEGSFTIHENTFNGFNQWGDTYYSNFSCSYWGSDKDLSKSAMEVNILDNTFNGVKPLGEENDIAVVRASYGIFNLIGNTFPTADGIYWEAAPSSSVKDCFGAVYTGHYTSNVSQYWHMDRTEPKSFAIANNTIVFETHEAPANTWAAWQGRKADVNMEASGVWEVTSTLTLTGEDRAVNKSMWLNIGIDWPILLFKQDENGVRSWKYWESVGSGSWVDVPAEKGIPTTAGEYDIKIAFNNGTITHSINGVEVASYTLGQTATAVKEIIFNSYSIGESYRTTWTYPVVTVE